MAGLIPFYLIGPEFRICPRERPTPAGMPMPKTTMHENNLSARWEGKIGATRKTLVVQYITITEPMDHATHHHFR